MKLNKTEAKLMETANELGSVGVDHGMDRRQPFGRRELNAARKLVEKGLLVHIPSKHIENSSLGYGRHGGSLGWSIHSRYKLVKK